MMGNENNKNQKFNTMNFLVKTLITTFAVVITSYLLGGVNVDSFITALVVAFVLGVLNMILKPVLVVLTIPVTVMSLGLFLLVINAFIIQLAAYFVSGFQVATFWWALLFSIILSVVSWFLELPARSRHRK
jgi:putative membrane protein